jgi:hypothetical protein
MAVPALTHRSLTYAGAGSSFLDYCFGRVLQVLFYCCRMQLCVGRIQLRNLFHGTGPIGPRLCYSCSRA